MVLADSAGVKPPDNAARDAIVKAGKSILKLPGLNRLYEPLRRKTYEALGSTDYLDAGRCRRLRQVIEQDLLPYAARSAGPHC
jgi:hypothetical protein